MVLLSSLVIKAQTVDSIYFHLYTDSLKKGQHNYINVDGKLSNGRWQPMTAKEVEFSCPTARFEGNELIIPVDFNEEKVRIKAILKSNPAIVIEKTIWIKTLPDPPLPRQEGVGSRESGVGSRESGVGSPMLRTTALLRKFTGISSAAKNLGFLFLPYLHCHPEQSEGPCILCWC